MIVQCALLKYYTVQHRDSSVNALALDQHHCADEAKWRLGGDQTHGTVELGVHESHLTGSEYSSIPRLSNTGRVLMCRGACISTQCCACGL